MVAELGNGGMERIERCELELGHSGVRAQGVQTAHLYYASFAKWARIKKSGREWPHHVCPSPWSIRGPGEVVSLPSIMAVSYLCGNVTVRLTGYVFLNLEFSTINRRTVMPVFPFWPMTHIPINILVHIQASKFQASRLGIQEVAMDGHDLYHRWYEYLGDRHLWTCQPAMGIYLPSLGATHLTLKLHGKHLSAWATLQKHI